MPAIESFLTENRDTLENCDSITTAESKQNDGIEDLCACDFHANPLNLPYIKILEFYYDSANPYEYSVGTGGSAGRSS
jgi:hypothetical protein